MHPARWKLTLIACAAASAGAGAQVSAPSDAGALPQVAPPAEESSTPEREWRLPPLRISGNISYDMRAARSAGEPSSIGHVLTGTLGTSTFIYAPWLATVSGTVGLSTSVTHSGSNSSGLPFSDSELVHERMRTRENFITGDARIDLFPRSRFPAEVHFGRQDSRTDTGLASPIEFQRQNFGGSVRYRPESGLYNVVGNYDHREQSGLGFRSKQDALSADFTTQWKANELGLSASHNRARSEGFDDESRFTGLVARHTYTPNTTWSVSSTANATRTEQSGAGQADLQVLQLSSLGVYHPSSSPLTMTGSLRGLALRDRVSDSSTDALSGSLGANYEVNPNLRVTASGGVSGTHTSSGNANFYNGSLGATYQGDALEFRGIHYDWFGAANVGAAVSNSSTAGSTTDRNLGLQLGHSATRSWAISPRSGIGLTLSQSLSGTITQTNQDHGNGAGTLKTMLNSASLSWQQSGDGRSGYARAMYSDSMELGGGHGRFQLFNFQLSGNFELGYGRSITADLTYQRTMQRASELHAQADSITGAALRTRSSGVAGEVSFRQNQVFGVPRLHFTSRVRLAQDVLKQPGQLQSIPDRETRLWENRLEWNIGRLTTQVELRLSQIDGRRVDSLWLRVQRNFGD